MNRLRRSLGGYHGWHFQADRGLLTRANGDALLDHILVTSANNLGLQCVLEIAARLQSGCAEELRCAEVEVVGLPSMVKTASAGRWTTSVAEAWAGAAAR